MIHVCVCARQYVWSTEMDVQNGFHGDVAVAQSDVTHFELFLSRHQGDQVSKGGPTIERTPGPQGPKSWEFEKGTASDLRR